MRRDLSILAVVGVAVGVSGCGGSDTEEHQLTFTTDAIEVEAVDEGERGPSRGDFRAFTQELHEEGSEESVGRLDGTVVVTDLGERDGIEVEYRSGEIQFSLDDGNIVSVGNYIAEPGEPVPAEGGVERAIVGGTGAYRGASGELTQTAEGESGYLYELDFDTPSE